MFSENNTIVPFREGHYNIDSIAKELTTTFEYYKNKWEEILKKAKQLKQIFLSLSSRLKNFGFVDRDRLDI